MDTLPLELIFPILDYVRNEHAEDPDLHAPIAPLSCINSRWKHAVESILWQQLIVTTHAHRQGPDLEDFLRFTSGSARHHRRTLLKAMTMRWIKVTQAEEAKDLSKLGACEYEPPEKLPIPRRMSQEELVSISNIDSIEEDSGETEDVQDDSQATLIDPSLIGALLPDEPDIEEPDEGCKDDMCQQLQLAQTQLLTSIESFWGYFSTWQADLAVQQFRIRLVCTDFCSALNYALRFDNERSLDFLRTDLPNTFRLPHLPSLQVLDVDGTRELAYWSTVLGLRLVLATASTVPKLFTGGGPLRVLPNRSPPWKTIGKFDTVDSMYEPTRCAVSNLTERLPDTEVSVRASWEGCEDTPAY